MGAKKVAISDLKHRLTFQTLSLSSDGQGGSIETWTNHGTFWGHLEARAKRERYFSEQIQPVGTHKLTMRWQDGISESMRVRFQTAYFDRTFQIKGIDFLNEKRFFIVLDLEENVGT